MTPTSITVAVADTYQMVITTSFSGTANQTYNFRVFTNGFVSHSGIGWSRKLGTGGDVGSASGSGLMNLQANDVIDGRILSSGTSVLNFTNMNFIVERK